MTDLIIKNAHLATHKTLVNILITDQHIARIQEIADDNANSQDSQSNPVAASYDAQGNFVCGGFYDSHIHLDKACILDRCTIEQGNLEEAVEETGKAKEAFKEADVYARALRMIEMAIKKVPSGCALSLRPIKKQNYVALRR